MIGTGEFYLAQEDGGSPTMRGVPKATTSEYVCRLDRHRTGNGKRCRRYKGLHVISP